MTTAGFIPLKLDAPRPVPPRYHILKAAQQVVEGDEHWMGAAQLENYLAAIAPGVLDPCDTARAITFQTLRSFDTFHGFTVYAGGQCTPFTVGDDYDEWMQRLATAFAAIEAQGVEKELELGAAIVAAGESPNPALAMGSPTLLISSDTTAVSASQGIGALEDYANQYGGQAVIHMAPSIAEAAAAQHLLQQRGGTGSSAVLETLLGTTVNPGGGYTGAKPNNANTATSATKKWAYVSGGVVIRRGPVYMNPAEYSQGFDRVNNLFTFSVLREYLAVWDTSIHAAVCIDLTKF